MHAIREFAFVHRYLTATILALVVGLSMVKAGESNLERKAAAWEQARVERMAVVDR